MERTLGFLHFTLWDCQSWFDEVERKCCQLLSPWATAREVSEGLFSTERKNLPLTGYGTKAFTLSLIENAVRVSRQQLSGDIVMRLLELGQELLTFPTTPLPEVKETLEQLSQLRRYQLVVFTKGELLDQENKLQRSGLEQFFSHMETVSNKTEKEYRQLCENLGVAPEQTKPYTYLSMWCGNWRSRRSIPTSGCRRSRTLASSCKS